MADAEGIQVVLERQDEMVICETGHVAPAAFNWISIHSTGRKGDILIV
jgi:hypothetical protein